MLGEGIEILILVVGLIGGFGLAAKVAVDMLNAPRAPKPEVPASVLIEEEQRDYEKLRATAEAHENLVSTLTATLTTARELLQKRVADANGVFAEFQEAKNRNATQEELLEIGGRYSRAMTKVAKQEGSVKDIQKTLDESTATLKTAMQTVEDYGQKIEKDKTDAVLASAHRLNAEAKARAEATLSASARATKAVQRELEHSRALSELAEGPQADRDLRELDRAIDAASGKAELEAQGADKGVTDASSALEQLEVMLANSAKEKNA